MYLCMYLYNYNLSLSLRSLTQTHRAKWVRVAGVLYKTPCALLLKVDNDYPQFGRLIEILVLNSSRIVFHVGVMETTTFLSHFNAYCVSPTPSHQVIALSHLHSPFPVHIYQIVTRDSVTKQVVVPKYHVSGCLY